MKKSIRDYNLKSKKVIIRCDFNVPIKNGKIEDDTRIIESIPTIKYAIDNGAKVILLSHLGRIKEESDKEKNNLQPVQSCLSKLLNQEVIFANETRGKELETKVNKLKSGEVLLIQNTRYEDLDGKKESKNDPELATYWASLGNIFINDAFGTCHRAHASNVGIASHLPSGIGFLIEKELIALEKLKAPTKPFVLILGGGKVQDKIGVIKNLITIADKILIGGGMAFTFLKAEGYNVGNSLVDEDSIDFCKELLTDYKDKIILPVDVCVSDEFSETGITKVVEINKIEYNEIGMDIGPNTIEIFKNNLADAKTCFWNGPLGVYEFSKYNTGTKKILEYISNLDSKTVLGGGDIVAAATKLGLKEKINHASTGGGATLEYLEGKLLPGIEVIKEA